MPPFKASGEPTLLPTDWKGNMLPLEMLKMIIDFLEYDDETLLSVLLMNKAWNEEATRVLWEAPPAQAFLSITPMRRQLYARFVRALIFENTPTDRSLHEEFRDLEFSQLECVRIYHPCHFQFPHRHYEEFPFDQYIQRKLTTFIFQGGGSTQEILTLLETQCPQLQHIQLAFEIRELTPERLLTFFDTCTSLKSIKLSRRVGKYVDEKVLGRLAGYSGVQKLEVRRYLDFPLFYEAFKMTSQPFKNLRSLNLRIHSESVPLLVANVKDAPFLTSLVLQFVDTHITDSVTHISRLHSLEKLVLLFRRSALLERTDLLELGNLSELTKLQISPPVGHFLECPGFTDDDFISVFENKNNLKTLFFNVYGELSMDSINSLAESCPLLVRCGVDASCELSEWHDTCWPIFHNLQTLEVFEITYGPYANMEEEE